MTDLKKAAQQALEALDLLDEYDITRAMLTDEAIEQVWATADAATDALRAALAQQEQEPVAFADRISFDQAMKSGKGHDVWPEAGDYEARTGRKLRVLYTHPPRREQEQEQEPVARMHADGSGRIISQATYDEAQRQGGAPWSSVRGYTTPLYTALRAALAQKEQEPVLVVEKEPDYMSRGHFYEGSKPFIDPTLVWKLPIGTKLYTAPPRRESQELTKEDVAQNLQSRYDAAKLLEERRQEIAQPRREWQGLTEKEREQATGWSVEHIEAALKEKNNG